MDAFLQLLEQTPMDRITVQDIAQRCGISRNTFYYHYDDIYALLEAVFRRDLQRLREARHPGEPAMAELQRMIQLLKQHPRVVYHVYDSVSHDYLQRFLFQATEELFLEYVRRTAGGLEISDKDLHFVCYAYQSMLMGILLGWVRTGMKDTLTETLEQVQRIFLSNTRHMLETAGQNS